MMLELDGDMDYVFTRFVIVEKHIKNQVNRYDTPNFNRYGVVEKWDNWWSSGFSSRIFMRPGIYTREDESLLPFAMDVEDDYISRIYVASTDVATSKSSDLQITIFCYDLMSIPDDG